MLMHFNTAFFSSLGKTNFKVYWYGGKSLVQREVIGTVTCHFAHILKGHCSCRHWWDVGNSTPETLTLPHPYAVGSWRDL